MDLYNYTYDLVRQIPDGMISTYGAVAQALGDIRAARAVGRMMNQNPDADSMPCFRIVQSDGKVGGFGLGVTDKVNRLKNDGILVDNFRIVDFDDVFFDDFKTEFPLKTCRKEQLMISEEVEIHNGISEEDVTLVAGFDVAYVFDDDWKESCGACVIMDYQTGKVVEEQTVFMPIRFPYIPTYLSYREKPFIDELFKQIDHDPSVLLVDGNGILHPFQCGLACHVGISADLPSIGVAKNLLCGHQTTDNLIVYHDKKVGFAFYANNKVKKPVFISPGHKISLTMSVSLVQKMSTYKQPEPLRKAHNLATSALRKYH